MNLLEKAKRLAALGFEIFPIIPGEKLPAIPEFPQVASCDPAQLDAFWQDDVLGWLNPFNIGISTSRFKQGALLVVDVDTKGKGGPDTLLALELEGKEFPETFTQTTPTGGFHLVYYVPHAVKQGVDVFGPGLDVRSKGGYIVGWGSVVEKGEYDAKVKPVAYAPQWMIDACGKMPEGREDAHGSKLSKLKVDQDAATIRAIAYLQSANCPHAVEGAHGDQTTFRVCAQMKDFGLSAVNALTLLWDHWNQKCSPPWEIAELERKIANAYSYGTRSLGASSPEADFEPVPDAETTPENLSPVEKLNKEFAFIVTGGHGMILWETVDEKGNEKIDFLNDQTFHKMLSSQLMTLDSGRKIQISEYWMSHADRRTYQGLCFRPGLETPPRFYNLWDGFSIDPLVGEAPKEAKWALDAFFEHAKKNVCDNDEVLFQWLMGYFAHMIQRPFEKPLTALVFKGRKGVGKNVLVDQVGALIRSYYLVTANRRYLSGNFNGHLERLLLFVLDEAFWSGDKQTEGVLKDLITGHTHLIERKGREPFTVDNCTRVVIIGNEEWVVPASEDERRFAVFKVGDGRKQDGIFFTRMRKGMNAGGHALLLTYLMSFDLSKTDVNAAPKTRGLLEQKIESMDLFHQWLFSSLIEGQISGLDFSTDWPERIGKGQVREALSNYAKFRNIRSRIPDERIVSKLIKTALPTLGFSRIGSGGRERVFILPTLKQARKEWEIHVGQAVNWDEINLSDEFT